MLGRWMTKELMAAMEVRRGVNLSGARQVGKSTLAGILDLPNAKRYTFDDKFIASSGKCGTVGRLMHAA